MRGHDKLFNITTLYNQHTLVTYIHVKTNIQLHEKNIVYELHNYINQKLENISKLTPHYHTKNLIF